MQQLSLWRLYLMRAMYLLMAVGLAATVWPSIIAPHSVVAGPGSVVRALLGALAVMSALGLRYPVKMLPLLIFELLWKIIWVAASAIPMWRGPGLDGYASETLFACLMGVVLVPIAIPWRYAVERFVLSPGARWRNRAELGPRVRAG